ncbi:hypothetical protein IWW50_006653 [Coemansia erecta]|nr:hypothetical protein GGF43_004412 [Coemansia sp. RSA 2618]KAJ2815969.1 hypothetical protein IWW50_006653 [Coemansia erecta]
MNSSSTSAGATPPGHDSQMEHKTPMSPINNGMGPPVHYPAYPYGPEPVPQEIRIIAPPVQFRRFGNAAALGLITFGICTVQQSMMLAGMSVGYGHGTRAMAGQSIAVAGVAQFAAGLWQIANGDTFEGAAFTSFGASWFAKGIAQIPGLGVLEYQESETPLLARKQNGIVTLAWGMWVLILLLGNVKSHVANIILFSTLNLQIDFECAGTWTDDKRIVKAGAWFGFFCGLSAMYNAAAILLNEENFWFNLPVGNWYSPTPIQDEEGELCAE